MCAYHYLKSDGRMRIGSGRRSRDDAGTIGRRYVSCRENGRRNGRMAKEWTMPRGRGWQSKTTGTGASGRQETSGRSGCGDELHLVSGKAGPATDRAGEARSPRIKPLKGPGKGGWTSPSRSSMRLNKFSHLFRDVSRPYAQAHHTSLLQGPRWPGG